MAKQGQKLDPELREKIKARLAENDSIRETAREFGVSPSTVKGIKDEKPDEFEHLRTDKKQEMIDKIWASLIDAADLGHQMVMQAKRGERDIPLNHVSTFYGTMYDKMALMKGENTQNVGGDGLKVVLNMPTVAKDESEWNAGG